MPAESGSSRSRRSAPTPLAAQSLREVAEQAVGNVDAGGREAAQRDAERDPRRADGSAHAAPRAPGPAHSAGPAGAASPAAASPGVPLTQRSSPARAPSRRKRRDRGHEPASVTVTVERSARRVAADQCHAVPARESVEPVGEAGEPLLVH